MNQSVLRNKRILIIDKDEKKKNDRTWCFWEKEGQGTFDPIVFRAWQQVYFYGNDGFEKTLDLGQYTYKWIKGLDFYTFVKTDLAANPNITFLSATIERLTDTADGGFVITDAGQFIAALPEKREAAQYAPAFQRVGDYNPYPQVRSCLSRNDGLPGRAEGSWGAVWLRAARFRQPGAGRIHPFFR